MQPVTSPESSFTNLGIAPKLLEILTRQKFTVPTPIQLQSIPAAIEGKDVILEPYEPFPGYKVAMIAECGAPIEFIETTLSEEEIWYSAHKGSVIYPEE